MSYVGRGVAGDRLASAGVNQHDFMRRGTLDMDGDGAPSPVGDRPILLIDTNLI